jgi:hypothetical protein
MRITWMKVEIITAKLSNVSTNIILIKWTKSPIKDLFMSLDVGVNDTGVVYNLQDSYVLDKTWVADLYLIYKP